LIIIQVYVSVMRLLHSYGAAWVCTLVHERKEKRDKNSGPVLAIHHRETLGQCTALEIVSSAMLNTMQNTGKP
jgi:hypothetical protein